MEASEPLPEAPEQGTAKSAQQPISSSTLTLQPLTLSLPLQSSSGSGFVILDEDDEDDLEISIPLDGGDGGASVEEASAVPVDAPAALDPPASTAVEPVPIEQEPLPQQVEGAEDEDDFFTGDEAFIFAAVATLPAPSVSEPEALTAAEPDAAAAAPVTASAEEEEIALTASSSPVPLEQPEQPMLTPVADPEPPQQPEEPEQQPPAPMAAPEPAPAEAEDDDFGDFAVPTEVVPPSSTASQPEPATEPVPAAAVQLGDFEAPPAVDAPTLAPQKPEPPMEPSAPAAVAATDGGGEQEAAEEDEFGDFEAPAPMPPAPPGVATPPPATAEAAEAEASLAATVPTQEPHAAGSGFEHDDFDDFGDDMEFVSASPLAPAPAPAMLPPAEAPPQEAAVVPAAPIHAPSAAPDAGDPHTFFKAAYGQGLQQPPAGKAPSWAAGQRRRLLAELDANLEARCQTLGQARLEPRASPWAAAILRKELLATTPGGGHQGDGGLRLPTPQEEDEGDGESSENTISITWALASSPAPPRFEPPIPPPQVTTTAPKAAIPAVPAAPAAPAPSPVVDDTSDLDLDFLAGPTNSSSSHSSGGGDTGNASFGNSSGGLDGSVSALNQTLRAMGLGGESPPTAKSTAATAAATFSSLSLSSSAPPLQPPIRMGPLSAEAEAVIAEVPDLGFVLSKVPFLPHHNLAMGSSARAVEKEGE